MEADDPLPAMIAILLWFLAGIWFVMAVILKWL